MFSGLTACSNNSSSGGVSSDGSGIYVVFDNECISSSGEELIIPDSQANIYEMAHDVPDSGVGACQYISTDHTGFVSVLLVNSVDIRVFAYINGANMGATSLLGILTE